MLRSLFAHVRAAQLPTLVRLVQTIGGRSAFRYVRWIGAVPVPFWRRRFKRPKLWRIRWLPFRVRVWLLPPLAGAATVVFRGSAAGGKVTETAAWEEEVGGVFKAATKVPGKEDEVKLLATSGAISQVTATTTEWKTLDCTGYAKTLTVSGTAVLKITGTTFKLVNTMTLSLGASVKFEFTSAAGTLELITGTRSMPETTFNGAGTFKLGDNWTGSNKTFTVTAGTFETQGHNMEIGKFSGNQGSTVKLGSSKIELTGASEIWTLLLAGPTLETETSTIEIVGSTEGAKFFKGGGKSYNKLVVASDNAEIRGSNTFTTLEINTRGKSVKGTFFEKGTTQTMTSRTSFKTNSTGAEKIKLLSSTSTKTWTLKVAEGTIEVKGVELTDSTVEGGSWYDNEGVNVSNNVGWKFEAAPKHEHTLTIEQAQGVTIPKELTRTLATITQAQAASQARTVGRAVSVTQSSSAALVRTPGRIVSATQGQASALTRTVARSLTAEQASAPSLAKTIGRSLSLTQGSSATIVRGPVSRTLTVSQGSSVATRKETARFLSISQGQSVATGKEAVRFLSMPQASSSQLVRSLARSIPVSQGSASSVGKEMARTATIEQAQATTMLKGVGRILSSPQGQAVSRALSVTRFIALTQSGAATLRKEIARLVKAEQASEASQHGEVESSGTTISVTQGSTASLGRSVARTTSVGQGQATTLARNVGRALSASTSSAAVVVRTTKRTTTVAQSSSVTLSRSVSRTLRVAATVSIQLTRALTRSFSVGQGQEAVVEGEVVRPVFFHPGHLSSSVTSATLPTVITGLKIARAEPLVTTQSSVKAARPSVVEPSVRTESSVS